MANPQRLHLDQPAIYTIRVQGRIAERRAVSYAPLAIGAELDEWGNAITTIHGEIADQAALHGLLRSLYSLGLPLLCVCCEPPGDAGTTG